MICLNNIGNPIRGIIFTLLVTLIAPLLFHFFCSPSLLSAQAQSDGIYVYYLILHDEQCPPTLEDYILGAIKKIGTQQGKDESTLSQIRVQHITQTQLQPTPESVITEKELIEFVKKKKGVKYALTINPEIKENVRFNFVDPDKNLSYRWAVNAMMTAHLEDRLQHVAERIQSIITGGPYKLLFSCFTNESKNENLASLSKSMPIYLRDSFKKKLQEKDWIQFKIDADYKDLAPEQCKAFHDEYIENYFRDYDCIFTGRIFSEKRSVIINLDYRIGGKEYPMDKVEGKITDNLKGMVLNRILNQLPIIMKMR